MLHQLQTEKTRDKFQAKHSCKIHIPQYIYMHMYTIKLH